MSATVPPATTAAPAAPAAPSTDGDVQTFRGESLEELLPKIREELGADAVILRQRDGLKGGVGGFFQKRCVEVDARGGVRRVDTYAGADDAEARAALDGDGSPDPGAGHGASPDPQPTAAPTPPPFEAERFTRGPAPSPALRSYPPFTGNLPFAPADPAVAEGLAAPAIQAIFEAAAPFAQQLQMADAALPAEEAAAPSAAPAPEAEVPAAPPFAPAPAPSFAAPQAAAPAPAAAGRPAAADAQELALVEGGLSPALAADVVGETVSHLLPFGTPRQLKRLVRTALARRVPIWGPPTHGVLVLAGAGGSGKTLTTARIAAAYAAGSDLRVVALALRPRDGGIALHGLLAPAGVPVEVVRTAGEAAARLQEIDDRTLVVVDTPAVSPGDAGGVVALAADLRALGAAEVHVCMPATMSAAAGRRVLDSLAPLSPAAVVLTHVDETPQVGAVVELAIAGGPPLSFVGRDSALDEGLAVADPAAVAALVLP